MQVPNDGVLGSIKWPKIKQGLFCAMLLFIFAGQGWDRHLFALRTLAAKEGKTPTIFADPAYSFINHIILSTSTLSAPAVLAGGFAPVVPNGLGIGYSAFDDSVGCNITSYPDSLNGSDFVACVTDCWKDIQDVLSKTNKQ